MGTPGIGSIMYIEDSLDPTKTLIKYIRARFERLKTLVVEAQAFWAYVDKHWMGKIEMWSMGNMHLPHVGQDTNTGIESYHGNTKAVLKAKTTELDGRRLDWLVHELIHDVVQNTSTTST